MRLGVICVRLDQLPVDYFEPPSSGLINRGEYREPCPAAAILFGDIAEGAMTQRPREGSVKPAHLDFDILGDNPFPSEDPRHDAWLSACRLAAEETAQLTSDFLAQIERTPLGSAERLDRAIDVQSEKFDIQARWVVAFSVWDYEGAQRFQQFIDRLSKSTVSLTEQLCPPDLDKKEFLAKLRFRLTHRSAHWTGEAFKLAREAEQVPQWEIGATNWEEVEIWFLSDERVQTYVGGRTETRNFAEMGFEDGRTGKPNLAWVTLRSLATSGGTLPRASPGGARASLQKQTQALRSVLRTLFRILDDPLPAVEGAGYRARFKIGCRPSFKT